MQQSNAFKARGRLTIEQFDVDGNLLDSQSVTNVVVDDGLDYIASRMKDATATAMSHMAVGNFKFFFEIPPKAIIFFFG